VVYEQETRERKLVRRMRELPGIRGTW